MILENLKKWFVLEILIFMLLPVQGALAQSGEVLFFEDFEGGPGQWEIPGSMIITQEYAFEGSHSQTFAQVTHSGDAHTYPFAVVPGQTYYLHVAYMTLGGGGYIGIDLFNQSMQRVGEQWLIGDGGYAATLRKFDYNVFRKNREDLGVWKVYTQSYTIPDQVYFIRIKTQNWDMGLPNDKNRGVFFDNIEWSTGPEPSFLRKNRQYVIFR